MISPDFLFEKSGKLCDCVLLKVPFSPFTHAFLVCVWGGGTQHLQSPDAKWHQLRGHTFDKLFFHKKISHLPRTASRTRARDDERRQNGKMGGKM